MVFITSDIAVGSKAFNFELAEAIRPELSKVWDAKELEYFDLGLMQSMIHFGDISIEDFNAAYKVIKVAQITNSTWQAMLLTAMKDDPRYQSL